MNMTETEFWDDRRNIIYSRRGGAKIGHGIVYSHGYSLLDDLSGKSFFQVLILNITGQLPEVQLAKWVEASFICLSWPDPRIWCNQIGTLAGSLRTSPVAAICAGILASDSSLYGPGTVLAATRFITEALKKRKQGTSVEAIINEYRRNAHSKPLIPGFARPISYGDERVSTMEDITTSLRFPTGEHVALAYEIQDYLFDHYSESLNLAGYIMAFLSDQRMSAREIYYLYALCVNGGIPPCYAEAYENPTESFLPLRCDDVQYHGIPPRSLK